MASSRGAAIAVAAAMVGLASATPSAAVAVDLILGSDIGDHWSARFQAWIVQAGGAVTIPADGKCGQGVLCIALGESPASGAVINASVLGPLGSEAYALYDGPSANGRLLAALGNEGNKGRTNDTIANIGSVYGSFAVLEQLGFGFVHAFQPVIPSNLNFPSSIRPSAGTVSTSIPNWAIRSWHYHTEHPLELTDFFQGFDATCTGVNASAPVPAGCTLHDSWESMFGDFLLLVDWLVANGQNRLEFIPLYQPEWGPVGNSSSRLARFRNITATLHTAGLLAVVDVPVAERQQNAWYMTSAQGTPAQNHAEIAASVTRWAGLGFDVLASESGFSEFTHPACDVMLDLLNFTADYAWEAHGMPMFVKAHCSTGQTCPDYPDPRTGEPINFNFLPALGSPRLNVMPHTVQVYAVDDPASNSYGNDNFTYMFDFATWLAQRATAAAQGREVVYHGESAYWVNYDIDVGLALGPLYGERRLYDLRYLAQQQAAHPGAMTALTGSNVFASGSCWSYWLGNALTARAAWNPQLAAASQQDAFSAALEPVGAALFYGSSGSQGSVAALRAVLWQAVTEQRAVLIQGAVSGVPAPPAGPNGTTERNGMAYLIGSDTWSTVETLVEGHTTQPDRVFLTEIQPNSTADGAPGYLDVLRPLLGGMETVTASHAAALLSLRPLVRPEALTLFDDLQAAFNLTALRAAQVAAVYEAASPTSDNATRAAALLRARGILNESAVVVAAQAARYGINAERITAWRGTPTSYGYGFIWTVKSLFYMWRDYGVASAIAALADGGALDLRRLSPCYQNINDPVEVGFGDGTLEALVEWAHREAEKTGINWVEALADCLAAPAQEPVFPRDL